MESRMAFFFRKHDIQAALRKQGGDGRTGRTTSDDKYVARLANGIAA